MSCIFRVSGSDLNIDALVRATGLKPYSVWHKGEIYRKSEENTDSGAAFVVSEADLDEFEKQVSEATEFLEQHSEEVSTLVSSPGVECAFLNFGIELRSDMVARIDFLPARFIKAACATGVEVQLSHYCCSDEDEE